MVDTGTKTGKAAFAAALAAVVVGASVLAGWFFEVEFLKRIASGLVAMNPATAVAFVLAGTSLALFLQSPRGRDQKSRALILTARLCALVVALIGLGKLAGILCGWDLGVDRWLFASKLPDGLQFPNRMAPNAALSFLLFGSALLLVDVKNRSVRFCVEFSVVVVGFVSFLAVLGHVYNVQSLYRLGDSIPMALHTVITFSMLSVAFLLSHTDGGLLAVFAGKSAGGAMARRLLPAAVLVPAGVGWLTLQGEQAEIYSEEIGQAVFAVANILVFTFLICWSAKGLFSADLRRKKDEEALRESAAFLEAQVNSSIDGILVVGQEGKQSLQNQRFVDLLKIPQSIADEKADDNRLRWVTDMTKNPEQFAEKVRYLYDHPAETSRDEVELKDGTVLDRYSSPVIGKDGRYYGRIWTFRDITERRQAEDALRESDEKFHQLADNITDSFWIRSPDLREVHYISPAFERIWGRSLESLYANPNQWADFILPEDRERALAAFATLTGDTPNLDIEYRIVRPGGEIRWVHVRGFQVRDAANELIRLTGIVTDITERKQADAALLSSEARTKAIVQSSLDCIVAINHEGKIFEFNPAAEKMFGFARAEVLGRELAEVIIPPSLRERHRQGMMHYLATGEARVIGKRIEITALRSDGSEFPVELAITRMGPETPPTFTGFIRDISERKRAEWQLNIQHAISRVLAESSTLKQASAKILQTVCENLNWDVGEFWHLDRRAGVMQFDDVWIAPNTGADDFITLSRQMTFARGVGLPGRVWESGKPAWVPDVVVDANFPRLAAAKKAGLHSAFSVPILAGNEVVGVIEFFSREIRQPDDELLRMFAVLGSQLGQFFERKRLEQHLTQSQKMETVGKLSSGIAHEFNSILTAIIGQSELLLGDLPAQSPLAKNATEINKAAGRAATLTRQLLAYGRKQFLRPETLDLNHVLTGMEGMLHHLMGGGVDMQIVPAPDVQMVKADAGQIEQVIMNMVINARDAMPNGGKLTLETANVSFEQESVGHYPELKPGDYVMLAITDTGTGMSEEVKARAFEPFFTTKGISQGTGLGLSTCYGIIKQSGGHISVYSEPARGATFKIYLPQAEQTAKIPAQRLDSSDLPRGTETILLVEDDPALREMAATLLRRLGYKVLAAANGIEALSLKHRRDTGHVDLLFTDVVMPHMSGKELADRVRVLSPHTRILFTSAYTENAIIHQGVLNKGVALLQKPFTPSALARKLREVLDAGDISTKPWRTTDLKAGLELSNLESRTLK
jgi:two-component system cell cycle sensor histidine kinase/response regulator CckA